MAGNRALEDQVARGPLGPVILDGEEVVDLIVLGEVGGQQPNLASVFTKASIDSKAAVRAPQTRRWPT